jgi:porin
MRTRRIALRSGAILVAIIATCGAPIARAGDDAVEDSLRKLHDTLTGDWAGLRGDLARKGIEFGLLATNDAMFVVDGGADQESFFPGLIEPTLGLDLERLLGWRDTLAFVRGFGMYGRDPSDAAGAIDTPSNIANPAQTFRIYEAWIERSFLDDRFDVRAGLYALDSEFDAKGVSAVLMNSGFGTGIDLSQTGLNGPCIYSNGCLGARVRYRPGSGQYLQLAVMDAVAGDPDDPYGTHVEIGNGEGVLAIGEYGYEQSVEAGVFLRAAVGVWYYTSKFDDLRQTDGVGGPARSRARPGVYAFLEGELFRETADGSE